MSVPLIINGITFNYPQQFDTNWGPTLTAWSTAVTNGMLQKAGGAFTLTADADFGMSYGLKALYLKSEEGTIASTGVIRLANASTGIVFRNSLDSADLALTVNSSNLLTYNGVPVGPASALLDSHIYVGNASNQPADVAMSGDTTITNLGVVTIANSAINNVKVSATAAIDRSKLASGTNYVLLANSSSGVMSENAAITASRAVTSDANGQLTASTTTSTELGYVSGVTSSIQTQINAIASVPAGVVIDYAGTAAPTGWLPCDGASVLRATYPALFTAIGTTWGSVDGTHFNVPSLSRAVTVGSGGASTAILSNSVGSTGGSETHTMTTGELVAHSHVANVTDPGHTHGNHRALSASGSGGNALLSTVSGSNAFDTDTATTGITVATTNTGSTTAFTIMQPSAVMLKIIKY